MTKHIQAYFRTEDQVEGARISLLPYAPSQVEAGHVDDRLGEDDKLLVQLLPVPSGSMNSGGTVGLPLPGTLRGSQSALPAFAFGDRGAGDTLNGEHSEAVSGEREMDPARDVIDTGDEPEGWKYVLSAAVEDEDYDKIVQKLRAHGAYIPVG
ncbi:hypothetical protein [Paenibacillus macerans]|uniref:hypothetical protein n=1 Tax=Paenibacillus macerans TaxID=44252 RepID=UPI00203C0697|nr:hypothetical protein [Paenibacillus macerans]MCM3701570.1 hypothetical protein [Paenibacillus macerans]